MPIKFLKVKGCSHSGLPIYGANAIYHEDPEIILPDGCYPIISEDHFAYIVRDIRLGSDGRRYQVMKQLGADNHEIIL